MEIEYYEEKVYGLYKMYVKNPEIAQAIRILTGKKTIDQRDIDQLTFLGHFLKRVMK